MTAYEEIMNALRFRFGDELTDELINEIVMQEHEPIETISKALDEYRAANSPELPDGWVMVPKVPTEEMVIDGFESEPDQFFSDKDEWNAYQEMSGCRQAAHRAKLCWAAMLAAAPKPEK